MTMASSPIKIPVGISACLLGDEVRFNGGHSRSLLCLKSLSRCFEYQRFCPEVAAGFPTPRPTMRLVGNPEAPELQFSAGDDRQNLAPRLIAGFEHKVRHCDGLDGYIMMKNSPSCGFERIKVYQENGHPHTQRVRGLFTDALMQAYPLLPVEEEGRLHDAPLRENFIMRVFAHYHFRKDVREQPRYANLINYHSSYKYLLLAHSQEAYRSLGKMLADAGKRDITELMDEYQTAFMAAVSKPAKRGAHCNAMQHILGYLKKTVSSEERQGILDVIEQYHREEVNLATPIALLNHYIQREGSEYVRAQRYLEPYPAALGLRNQV